MSVVPNRKALMKRFSSLFILALLVVLIVAALFLNGKSQRPNLEPHASSSPQYFRLNLGTEPPTLDSAEADDLISIAVLNNIMRGLTQYGENSDIVPAYAERWTRSADGLHYIFHLRRSGRWSDGKPVTAQDFVYGWQRVLDPKTGAPYAFLLFDLKNARPFYEGKLTDPRQLGFRAVDDYTLEVTLERPIAYFLQVMAFTVSLPQRRDIIERYGRSFTEPKHNITNGPYLLSRWDHENQIILKPNPKYWAGAPKNDGIQMFMIPEPNTSLIMYENNELDFVETTSSLPTKEVRRLKNRPDYHRRKLHAISYFGFNTRKKPFDDIRVRKAFIHAFDRSYIPKLFQGGETPIESWISPGLFAYNPEIGLQFDIEEARALLTEAGYPDGKGFPPVELLYANTTPENRQIAEIAQFQWQQNLGVKVELKNVEWKVFLNQLDDDPPQIFRLQWYVDYPDPDSFLGVFISESGNNHSKWTDAGYDDKVKRAAVELDPVQRARLYDAAQRKLVEEDAVIMPLFVIPKTYLLKPNVTGFRLNELNVITLDHVRFKD